MRLVGGQVSQLRAALYLLAGRLPQPSVRPEDLDIPQPTADRLRRVLQCLLRQLDATMPVWDPEEPLCPDNVIPMLGPASDVALNIMQFLETGIFDYHDNLSSAADSPATAPIRVMRRPVLMVLVFYLNYLLARRPLPGHLSFRLMLLLAVVFLVGSCLPVMVTKGLQRAQQTRPLH